MAGKKKKLNAKKKAENQRHVEHRKQQEDEESVRPKSLSEAGCSSAPGYAKRQDECCSAKHELQNSRVPSNNTTEEVPSLEEGLTGLQEKMSNMDLSQSSHNEEEEDFPEFITTGYAEVIGPFEAGEEMKNESKDFDSSPKFVGESYVRKVKLEDRKVNKLSRPSHIDLYDIYFKLSTVLEYLSNYTVQVLVAKNKGSRKPFLKKLQAIDMHEDLKMVIEGLPEYQESHRKPMEIDHFQNSSSSKKQELSEYINNLSLPPQSEQEPPNPEYFVDESNEGVLSNNDFPNPFLRIADDNTNDVSVFSHRPYSRDLSLPRLSILSALIGQKRSYKRVRPALTNRLIVDDIPKRFLSKFLNLMTSGLCFLGKLIIESLSPDDATNRGNIFNFADGDVGFWWAAVIILDWNEYLMRTVGGKPRHRPISCIKYMKTIGEGCCAYKAMLNLGPDGLYFTEQDEKNFKETVERIKHKRTSMPQPEGADDD